MCSLGVRYVNFHLIFCCLCLPDKVFFLIPQVTVSSKIVATQQNIGISWRNLAIKPF